MSSVYSETITFEYGSNNTHLQKLITLFANVKLLTCSQYEQCFCRVPKVGIVPLKREMCPPKKK